MRVFEPRRIDAGEGLLKVADAGRAALNDGGVGHENLTVFVMHMII
jgi:hypothetical protein